MTTSQLNDTPTSTDRDPRPAVEPASQPAPASTAAPTTLDQEPRSVDARIRIVQDASSIEGPAAFTHGPSPARRRGALAILLAVLVTAAVSAAVIAVGDLAPAAFRLFLIFDVAFLLLTLSTGITRPVRSGWTAVRSPLLSAQFLVIALVLLWLGGVEMTSMAGLLEISIIAGLVLAAARLVLARLFHPRVVVLSATGEVAPPSPRDRSTVFAVVDFRGASSEDLVEAAVTAVDRVHADVVRVEGGMSPEDLTHLSWGLRSREVPLQLELIAGTVTPSRIVASTHDGGSLLVSPPSPDLLTYAIKRAMDILGSAFLILVLSPLLIGTALAVKLTDGGPSIYRQERIGKDGVPFDIYKFRTMAVDADARLQELLRQQMTDGKPLFKVQNDPRLTKIGGFLRRYSIDELPQLFNVLLGTMSLVGPRPQRDAEVALYTGTADHRLGVRPGMTGLWQVSGRSNLSWEEAQHLDVYYAHNWSIGMDLSIFLRTFKAVLGKDGAY